MPETKPYARVGEVVRWIEDRNQDPNAGEPAVVIASREDGVLRLFLLLSHQERRSVRYNNDPYFNDRPNAARWKQGILGGVWDYVVPGPRPGRVVYPEVIGESVPLEPAEAVSVTPIPEAKPTLSEEAATVKLEEMMKAGMKAGDAAEVMRQLTGSDEWTAQGIGQKWRYMREPVQV